MVKDPKQIALDLINGLELSEIPEELHPALLVPLTVIKNEARIAKKFAIVERVNDIVAHLTLSAIPPDNDLIDEDENSGLTITRDINPPEEIPIMEALNTQKESDIAKIRVIKSEYKIAVDFWANEWTRFVELRNDALKELQTYQFEPNYHELQTQFDREWFSKEDQLKQERDKELNQIKAKIIKLGGTIP